MFNSRNADGTLAVSQRTKERAINWINDLEDLMNLSIPARIARKKAKEVE